MQQRRRAIFAATGAGAMLAAGLGALPSTTASATGPAAGSAAAQAATVAPTVKPGTKPGESQLYVVQAVPGAEVDVRVDGRQVGQGVASGEVVGPLDMAPGAHKVVMSGDDWAFKSRVRLTRGGATDVVLHRPAARDGEPVVSTYQVPNRPIGPDKARVVLAHTATAPPADVSVDGQTVFRNIANGEFAKADLPSGGHEVALLPTGATRGAFLGPLDVDLPSETVTMVYAVGVPQDNSMRVVSHAAALASDGSVAPSRIETGSSAGLAADTLVSPFGAR